MGKKIIIKGADFSADALIDNIVSVLEPDFYPNYALGSVWGTKQSNMTRCCVLLADLSQYVGTFNRVKMTLKEGFDYVFALGSSTAAGKYYKGDCQEVAFAWITDYEYVIAPLSETWPYLSINFRFSDNVTEFKATAKVSDIVDEIVLYAD